MEHVQPISRKGKKLLIKFAITQDIVIKLVKIPAHPKHSAGPNKKQYNCEFCQKNFATIRHKHRHEIICKQNRKQSDAEWVQKQKQFKCTSCNYSSAQKGHLQVHLRIHTGEKPFPCSLCKKYFRRRGDLQEHIFTHTGEKSFTCSFCDKGFSRKTNKMSHEKLCKLNPKQKDKDWVEEQRRHKCDICTYRARTKSDLTSHVKIHTGTKPFGCPFCSKHFITRSKLCRHLSTHTREKPFKCLTCDYSTACSSDLSNHVGAVHKKEIRVFCSICSKGFYTKYGLNHHIRTHAGEKAYSCQFCSKCFTQNATKTRHQKTCKLNPQQKDKEWVDSQKKFKCDMCGYASRASSDLAKQSRTHSGNQQFKRNRWRQSSKKR